MTDQTVTQQTDLDREFDVLVSEISAKLEAGFAIELADYEQRHPKLSERLRRIWPTLIAMADLGHLQKEETPAASETPIQRGMLGDYRILREVGRGGMGTVYEAEQISLDRRVALKVLPFAAVLDKKHLQRFKNEAQIAAGLIHQNIVPVYAVGQDRGVHYYAMQYVDGQTVADIIRQLKQPEADPLEIEDRAATLAADLACRTPGNTRDGAKENTIPTLEPKVDSETHPKGAGSTHRSSKSPSHFHSAVKLAIQAADALEYAHEQGVIHRDVKPANLIVEESGRLWITDFGLAHIETGHSLTVTGDILGTLRYMSPEQALAKRIVVDHRTDIYSLGVTLYELLVLQPAFTAEDRRELLRQIAFEEPRRPRQVIKAIPVDLETILLKAIEKNPADRYGTAQELAEDLSCFLQDRPIHARRPTLAQITRKWCHRHKSLVTTMLTAMMLFLIFVATGSSILAMRLNDVAKQEAAVAKRERDALLHVGQAKTQTERLLVRSYMYQAQVLCEKGEIGAGMLWMARSLEVAPNDAVDLRRHICASLAAWRERLHALTAVFQDDHGIRSVVLSPDATQVVTGSAKGRLRIWDTSSGRMLVERIGHEPEPHVAPPRVMSVTYSPDGSRILSSATDKTARLWDAETLEPIGSPLLHPGEFGFDRWKSYVFRAVFSPSGEYIATCGGGAAQLWNGQTGERIGQPTVLRNKVIGSVAFSPDSSRLVISSEGGEARVWDITTQQPVGDVVEPGGYVNAVDFNSDGSLFVTGNNSGIIQFWNTETSAPVGQPLQHGGTILDVDVFKRGGRFISAGMDSTARIWRAESGRQLGQPLRHRGQIGRVDVSRDGTLAICASLDGTARMWSLAASEPKGTTLKEGAIAFSPDGAIFVSGNQILDSATKKVIAEIPLERRKIYGVSFASSSGNTEKLYLAVASEFEVQIWDANSLTPIVDPFSHPSALRNVCLSPDGRQLATTCFDRKLRIWDVTTAKARVLTEDVGKDVVYSTDGAWLAASVQGAAVRVWNAKTLAPIGKPIQCSSEVTGIASSPDSSRIATALANGMGHVWRLADRTTVGAPMRHENGLRKVAFSPDGTLVVSVGVDKMVRFWDADTIQQIGPPLENETALYDVEYDPSGANVLVAARLWPAPPPPVAGVDKRMKLWTEVITGMELNTDVGGAITVLDAPTWLHRRRQLEALGGPPLR